MRLEFQNRWVRLLIEFLPATPAFRRYRALPARLDPEIRRVLRGEITRRLRRSAPGEAA